MTSRRLLPCIALIAALIGMCSVPNASPAAEPFVIDAIISQTGQTAFLGKEEGQALELLETLTNRNGGINGRPIHFAIHDTQSTPQVAVQLLSAALGHHPAAVLGGSIAAECNAMAPLLEKNGPVEFCLSPSIHPKPGGYVFAVSPPTAQQFVAAKRYFHERGWHKIAYLITSDASGQEVQTSINEAFGSAPDSIVDRETFAIPDLSVTAQMTRIKNSGADVVLVWATGAPFATALRGARDVGLTIPMLASPGDLVYGAMSSWAPFMYDPLYFPAFPFIDASASDAATQKVVAAFNDSFKAINVRPDIGQSLSWDPALLIIDALKHIGTNATPAQLREYILGIGKKNSFVGLYGHYNFVKYPVVGVGSENVNISRWDAQKNTWVAVTRVGGAPLSGGAH